MNTSLSQQKKHKVCILLAVWGEKFIDDFFRLSLPSLLAPGNIPTIASEYPTRFVFLSRTRDIPVFERNKAYQKLKEICEIEFLSIDDLIVFGNYSTTLTLSFDRAIQSTQSEMLNTYFIFLTSDYIMADGSMKGLVRYIKKGYSGICSGNFQVISDDIEPFLLDQINPETHVLQIGPRTLLQESFKHLHPIVIASLYNQNAVHNYRANRFFLQLNQQIMAGRFYLLHMLCIKPEVTDYKVGSSCDYSFIPEMCPSGNIAIIDDSDDYLVIEIQSKSHELEFVNSGPYDLKHLAMALSEWTTQRHRENSKQSIYFHTNDITENDRFMIESNLDQFINPLTQILKRYKVQPHYKHPYWLGAIKAFNEQKAIIRDHQDWEYFDLTVLNKSSFFKKWYYHLYGVPPNVFPWHHRFREYSAVKKLFKQQIIQKNIEDIAVFYDTYQLDFMRYCSWFKQSLNIKHHFHARNLRLDSKLSELEKHKFELCILLMRVDDLDNIHANLEMIKRLIKDKGKVLIFIPNEKNHYSSHIYNFEGEFSQKISAIANGPFHYLSLETIHNNLTRLGTLTIEKINHIFSYSKKMRFLLLFLTGIPGSLISVFRNMLPNFLNKKSHHCTHIIVTLSSEKEFEP